MPMAGSGKDGDDTVIIKKYANRRLYNTRSSSYITLDHLAKMTREGVEFKVLDAKTGTDITHQILTQIIMEEEASGGEQILPVNFLRQLIGMYGNSMQAMLPHYLEASMDHFRANQAKLHKAFEDSLGNNPLAKLAQQNLAMFKAAAAAFMPGAAGEGEPETKSNGAQAPDSTREEIATLRAQMAEMQKKLDSLGK
jgi:polyhydroxyalkanoate synthesis repressor PhaR